MAEGINGLDRHQGTFKGRHAIESEGDDHELKDGILAQLMPRSRKGHYPVDHTPPAWHPEHDRERHAERLRPIRQRRIEKMVRSRPDINEDQRPEMQDGQAV